MDARLDTLSTELYQVNICVGHIARRQAVMGGFALEASPPPPTTSEAEDDDDDTSKDIEILALLVLMRCLIDTLTLCHSWQKGRVVLYMRVVILMGRVSIGPFC